MAVGTDGRADEGGEAQATIWWLAAAATFALLAIPFFTVDVPPVLDYPNHLARLYVLAFGADDPVLSAMYAPHWRIVPNLVLDIVGPPLLHLLPVYVAGRVLLAAAAFLPVIGVILYHRAAFGRRSYWPLGAGLFAFNGIFLLGFIDYLISVGLAFAAAAFWIRFADRRPVPAVAGGMVAAVALFFCHLMGLMLFALLAGAHELPALWRLRGDPAAFWRRAAVRGLMLALVLSPAIVLYALSTLAGAEGDVGWEGPLFKLLHVYSAFTTYNVALGILTVVTVGGVAIRFRQFLQADAGTLVALICVGVVYILAPRHLKSGAVIDARLPVLIALMVFAGVQFEVSRRAGTAIAMLLGALLVLRVADVGVVWRDHRTDLAELRATYAAVEPGAKVLVLTAAIGASDAYLASEPQGRLVPFLYRADAHLPGLMLIEKHAFWPLLFADPRQQPLVVRPPYDRLAAPLQDPPDYRFITGVPFSPRPGDAPPAYLADWAQNFDYVLLLDAGATDAAALRPDRLELLKASDMAALYRVRRP